MPRWANNGDRFPHRVDKQGNHSCRMCGVTLSGRKRSFCGPRCLRDFFMQTDWQRVRKVVWARDGGICMKCGARIRGVFHVDHIRPIVAGGEAFDLANLELSCPACNLSKGARLEL